MLREESPWPAWKILLFVVLTIAVCCWQGRDLIQSFRPAEDSFFDFFQEWASARNYLAGRPIYSKQTDALRWYLGVQPDGLFLQWNAHPPVSVLLVLPLAFLDYPNAQLAWTSLMVLGLAFSAYLVVTRLQFRLSPWAILPAITLLLLCWPLRTQIAQGQLSALLVLLIVLAWVLSRSGRWGWAGAVLGVAAAVKLFPAFLFLYPLVRGKWRALLAGAATFAFLNGAALLVFGSGTFEEYIRVVVPDMSRFRTSWVNASLTGFWARIFDPFSDPSNLRSLRSPLLATAGAGLSSIVVTLIVAWRTWKASSIEEQDGAFALTVAGMLLVSPITWDHYFLMLLLPAAWLARHLPSPDWRRWLFYAALAVLWVPLTVIMIVFMGQSVANSWWAGGWFYLPAAPLVHALTTLSLPLYAILTLFALLAFPPARLAVSPDSPGVGEPESARPVGAPPGLPG